MTRVELIDQLEDDLKANYSKATGYSYDLIKVEVGSPDTVNFKQFPSISFYAYGDPILEKALEGSNVRRFDILLTGYVKASNWKDIYTLSEDIEKFLYSDDFAGDETNITVHLDEEGPHFYANTTMIAAGLACFDLKLGIVYTQNL